MQLLDIEFSFHIVSIESKLATEFLDHCFFLTAVSVMLPAVIHTCFLSRKQNCASCITFSRQDVCQVPILLYFGDI